MKKKSTLIMVIFCTASKVKEYFKRFLLLIGCVCGWIQVPVEDMYEHLIWIAGFELPDMDARKGT